MSHAAKPVMNTPNQSSIDVDQKIASNKVCIIWIILNLIDLVESTWDQPKSRANLRNNKRITSCQ